MYPETSFQLSMCPLGRAALATTGTTSTDHILIPAPHGSQRITWAYLYRYYLSVYTSYPSKPWLPVRARAPESIVPHCSIWTPYRVGCRRCLILCVVQEHPISGKATWQQSSCSGASNMRDRLSTSPFQTHENDEIRTLQLRKLFSQSYGARLHEDKRRTKTKPKISCPFLYIA